MVCKFYLWLLNFKARAVNFWRAFCHNSFTFLSISNGKKSRMETVTGKVILDVTRCGKSVPWTSHLTIAFRKLVLLNWPTFTCGDWKLHLRHEMLHNSGQKCLKSIFRRRFERILDNKTLPEHEWKRIILCSDFVWFWETTTDFVVTLHKSTARIPRKWLLPIFLWL